ncbi:acyl-CoA dehydrogenase family protein [Marinicella sp. S1101]|uniref:acyl-CoA dehydrogenase family protein n=1 Tax=Marinicella marina TaxID=2996016 RepID=UPI002260DC06|nr:acyl-CoA dehydrogenase family protein [Marinicella marina]MCX7553826.1 acyl-CoA dehydrogenase family protein [Marinicella marina]MDJ1140902.1 acyl-CoA dehydrogenase family protein [Marinicella marina]
MNFELNEDQQAFVDAAKEFAASEMAPHAAKWDEESFFPVDVIKNTGELGFLGIYSPEAYGGLGLSRLDAALIFEEMSKHCTSTTAYLTIHNMCAWMLTSFGSEQLANEWGTKLTSGELLASYCLTEPGHGSDAGNLKTTATKTDSGYVLNGSKTFISGAGSTELLIVMARTGEAGPRGVSCFMVPADSAGISYGKKEDKMGWNSQPTRLITFEDVEIPADYLIGEEGEGFKFAMKGLDGGRINIASCSLGTAQAALNEAQAYMLERKQFGKTLASFQALQFKLADMLTELIAARQMVRLAAVKLDNKDQQATAYCAMAKRFATDVCFQICDEALQLHGGYGYIKEYPLERHVRDTRVHRILEGTNEIMRLIISRKILQEGATEVIV